MAPLQAINSRPDKHLARQADRVRGGSDRPALSSYSFMVTMSPNTKCRCAMQTFLLVWPKRGAPQAAETSNLVLWIYKCVLCCLTGTQGQKGDMGKKGDPGPQGAVGPQGQQGLPGQSGSEGKCRGHSGTGCRATPAEGLC